MLKVDVRRYFPSVRHDVLAAQVERRLGSGPLVQTLEHIVAFGTGDGGARGLPIGNLTSQVLANLYLDALDHRIARAAYEGADDLVGYLRYVDDLTLVGRSKAGLHRWCAVIEAELAELGLQLHDRKRLVQPVRKPLDLLGYRVTPWCRRLRTDNAPRARRRLARLADRYARGEASLAEVRQRIASWLGHARFADCEALVSQVLGSVTFARDSEPRQA